MANPTQLACVRQPRIPITQIGERHGSGKLNLSKGGASGTRIWQCAWFLYPRFCDWLLGRVSPNPSGFPQIYRPDTYSPCYPWLYCMEVSVEGEDLLGVDLSQRAFYRRAIVTAKYMPLEQGNSLHINSQMLTIPGSQYVFVGPNPGAPLGTTQTFTVTIEGTVLGGTFKLGLASSGGVGGVLTRPVLTQPIPHIATPAQMTTAVRGALGLQAGTAVDTVAVEGPKGGPWTIRMVSNVGYQIVGLATPEGTAPAAPSGPTTGTTPDLPAASVVAPKPWGLSYLLDGLRAHSFDDTDAVMPSGERVDNYTRGPNSVMFAYEMVGRPLGTFKFEVTFSDLTKKTSTTLDARVFTTQTLQRALEPVVSGIVIRKATGTTERTASDRNISIWVSNPYVNRREIRQATQPSIWSLSTDPNQPVRFYIGFWQITKPIIALNIIETTFPLARPNVKVVGTDPNLSDRLEQNVGKIVPMGEITIVRHQILAIDIAYFLQVIGTVNMFTFRGFPPWTLLLTGIEAKEVRLPNGTPGFDCTFKFHFNPFTHQALFRPAKGRWEFVRGILQVRVPNNVAIPMKPLDPASGRAVLNPNAINGAYGSFPPPGPPREILAAINAKDGAAMKPGLPGGVAGGPAVPVPGGGKVGFAGGVGEGVNAAGGDPWGRKKAAAKNTEDKGPKLGVDGDDSNADNGAGTWGEEDWEDEISDLEELLDDLDNPIEIDPDLVDTDGGTGDESYDPIDQWESRAQALGDLISRTIAADEGTAANDAAAAASGIAEDIRDAMEESADWLNALYTGDDTSEAEETFFLDGNMGQNPAASAAAARNAIRLGVPPTNRMRLLLGLPLDGSGDAAAMGDARMGAGGAPAAGPLPAGGIGPPPNAVNVGAATSVKGMATRIYDLGMIFQICDWTPILWMQ